MTRKHKQKEMKSNGRVGGATGCSSSGLGGVGMADLEISASDTRLQDY